MLLTRKELVAWLQRNYPGLRILDAKLLAQKEGHLWWNAIHHKYQTDAPEYTPVFI